MEEKRCVGDMTNGGMQGNAFPFEEKGKAPAIWKLHYFSNRDANCLVTN